MLTHQHNALLYVLSGGIMNFFTLFYMFKTSLRSRHSFSNLEKKNINHHYFWKGGSHTFLSTDQSGIKSRNLSHHPIPSQYPINSKTPLLLLRGGYPRNGHQGFLAWGSTSASWRHRGKGLPRGQTQPLRRPSHGSWRQRQENGAGSRAWRQSELHRQHGDF